MKVTGSMRTVCRREPGAMYGVEHTSTRVGTFLFTCSSLAILTGLLLASPAEAQFPCTAKCLPEATCFGQCQLSPAIGCGASCSSGNCTGTPAVCEETGAHCDPPRHYRAVFCSEGGGGGGPFCPPEQTPCPGQLADPGSGAEWAVVDFQVEGGAIGPAQVSAESDPGVGLSAFEHVILDRYESGSIQTVYEGPSRLIWTQPSGKCARVESEILSVQAPFRSPNGKSYFLFDVRISANGGYMALEPLYSDVLEQTPAAARFLRENLRLASQVEDVAALQVFVVLTVGESGQIGYSVAGAGELF